MIVPVEFLSQAQVVHGANIRPASELLITSRHHEEYVQQLCMYQDRCISKVS